MLASSICSRLALRGASLRFLHHAPRRPEVDGYSLRTVAKDRQNFVSGFCAGQTLAHRAIVQKFCDRGQRAEVRLNLIFRDDEPHDKLDRCIIEGIELDAGCRSSKCGHYFLEPV